MIPFGASSGWSGRFAVRDRQSRAANVGRFLQGAGGVFALVGAVYIATKNFPASRAATLIGATQMFGMAGGSAGQFVVGPLIGAGLAWNSFWMAMGVAGLLSSALLFFLLPAHVPEGRRETTGSRAQPQRWRSSSGIRSPFSAA